MATGTDRLPNYEQMERLISATASGGGGGGGGGGSVSSSAIYNGLSSAVTNLHRYFEGYNFNTTQGNPVQPFSLDHAISIADTVSDTSYMFHNTNYFNKAVYIGTGVVNMAHMFDRANFFNRPVYIGSGFSDGRLYNLSCMFANTQHWNSYLTWLDSNLPLTVNVTGILYNANYPETPQYNEGMTNWWGAYAQRGHTAAITIPAHATDVARLIENATSFRNTITFLGNNITNMEYAFSGTSYDEYDNIPESVVNITGAWFNGKSYKHVNDFALPLATTEANLLFCNHAANVYNNVTIGAVNAYSIFSAPAYTQNMRRISTTFIDTINICNAFAQTNFMGEVFLEGNIGNAAYAFRSATGSLKNVHIRGNINNASYMFQSTSIVNVDFDPGVLVNDCSFMFTATGQFAYPGIPNGAENYCGMFLSSGASTSVGGSVTYISIPETAKDISRMFSNARQMVGSQVTSISIPNNIVNMAEWQYTSLLNSYGQAGVNTIQTNLPYLENGQSAYRGMNLIYAPQINIGANVSAGNYFYMFGDCTSINSTYIEVGNNAYCYQMFQNVSLGNTTVRIGVNANIGNFFTGRKGVVNFYIKSFAPGGSVVNAFPAANQNRIYIYTSPAGSNTIRSQSCVAGGIAPAWTQSGSQWYNQTYNIYIYQNYT